MTRSVSTLSTCYGCFGLGGDVYVEVWDKTRMEGAAPLAAGLVGGAAGGAIVGAVQGASREDSEGRIWGVNFVTADDALPVLRGLALSE
jgi:hypothetical protein